MIVSLTGVLWDQPTPAAGVPVNPRTALTFPLGNDVAVNLRVVKASGPPVTVDLSAPGVSLKLTVKRTPLDSNEMLSILATAGAGLGNYVIVIPAALQRARQLGPGRYFYDVLLTQVAGATVTRDSVIPASPLIVEPGIANNP